MIERADQVLSRGHVYSYFTADRSINLGQQGRRNLDESDTTQIGRSREARQIANHATSQSYHDIVSFETRLSDKDERLFQRA